jgi:dihydrofolate synthase/folylpolyglutamate synthase
MSDRSSAGDGLFSDDADRAAGVYQALMARSGEGSPRPRLDATRHAVELLGDPHHAYPMIHLTGTNGKTSTSRIIESILRAYGLRTGLFTSPHLVSFNERIVIDGEPISDAALADNWEDISPYLEMTDAWLAERGEGPLTFFEALTVLMFAAFADAPIDVAVVEVGMGGEWDSTNVADARVAVFTPIDIDHVQRLGSTIAEIARTKAGIIKPASEVVTAQQKPEALAELQRAAELSEASLAVEGRDFELTGDTVAVGGQMLAVRGIASTYEELYLPLYGSHQGQNAAVAIAAVETFIGSGGHALSAEILTEGLAEVTSPGRLQLVGTEPTVLVDAAHNPHGALSLRVAIDEYFDFDEVAIVVGVLDDKDAAGILTAIGPVATRLYVTESESERAIPADALAEIAHVATGLEDIFVLDRVEDAVQNARQWAAESPKRLVVVTGSITVVGEVIDLARDEEWKP